MLYERWCRLARERAAELALRDLPSGREWTFAELHAAGERYACPDGPAVYPQDHAPEFLLAILAAWRLEKISCPLEPGRPPPPIAGLPAECVHVKITSATTRAPRLVAFTAEQLAADAANITATMGLRPDWPNLGVLSLAHSYGFSNLVLPLLLHGIPLALANATLPEALRHFAAQGSAWTLPAVPALWRTWQEADAMPAQVRLAISAGAALPVELEHAVFDARGLKIHNFYGATECGGIAFDATASPRPDAALAGSPLQNVELSQAEDGCLAVRSPAVGQSYWPEPDPRLANGCFRTSDLVELRDGTVYLRGRASDLINVAGRKVSPESIEQVLRTHPAIEECLVLGLASSVTERADLIAAIVALRHSATTAELRHFLLDRLPTWQVPREWWFVDSLSANARGKLSRAEWRQRFAELRRKPG
ncbi:MAG: fatty acid--CoA ligase family protein [Verrucomicrobia bacterium]|nr:fatty acid--CoA ligase family protein [Verrucomicrobiota bacterium]